MSAGILGSRRPLKVRQRGWAIALSARLARMRVQPGLISVASFLFAVAASVAFLAVGHWRIWWMKSALLLFAAAMMQLRLVCNLLDGMVAVEGHLGTPDGELYNDFPDRLSDWCLFVAIGYSLHLKYSLTAGWVAAVLSILTAYVRVLGRACGAGMHFQGPMAKQQRMALMCGGCVLGAIVTPWNWHRLLLYVALIVVIAGSLLTIIRRLKLIADDLRSGKR